MIEQFLKKFEINCKDIFNIVSELNTNFNSEKLFIIISNGYNIEQYYTNKELAYHFFIKNEYHRNENSFFIKWKSDSDIYIYDIVLNHGIKGNLTDIKNFIEKYVWIDYLIYICRFNYFYIDYEVRKELIKDKDISLEKIYKAVCLYDDSSYERNKFIKFIDSNECPKYLKNYFGYLVHANNFDLL